jgi:hypothetical protein
MAIRVEILVVMGVLAIAPPKKNKWKVESYQKSDTLHHGYTVVVQITLISRNIRK